MSHDQKILETAVLQNFIQKELEISGFLHYRILFFIKLTTLN